MGSEMCIRDRAGIVREQMLHEKTFFLGIGRREGGAQSRRQVEEIERSSKRGDVDR